MSSTRLSSEKKRLVWVYPYSLANGLDAATWLCTTRELRQLGWRVTLIGTGLPGLQWIRGVEVFGISTPNLYLVHQLIFHMRVLRWLLSHRKRIDIVLFNEISAPWLLQFWLARNVFSWKRPIFVMDTRSLHMPPRDKQNLRIRLRGVFLKLMTRFANHWVDGRTVITQSMAKTLNIPADKLWGIWPSGVDRKQFALPPSARRWPLSDEPINLIYIGSLEYERNLINLCKAVKQANDEGLFFNLSLVGDGTERADLERFAAQESGRINVLPPISHNQVPELLARAHIGVLPFPNEEKFRVSSPIKLFEYMAVGLAIFATRIFCHTNVIRDGKYAFWAENANVEGLLSALHMCWENRAYLPTMGLEATNAVKDWTWAEAAQKLENSLERGLARFSER